MVVKALDQAKRILSTDTLEEKFLQKAFPIDVSSLKEEEKFALDNLKKRKDIIKIEPKKDIESELTELGKEILKQGIQFGDVIDRLTKHMITDNSWKGKKFRRYDSNNAKANKAISKRSCGQYEINWP